MDDACCVRGGEAVQDLDEQRDRGGDFEPRTIDPRREVLADEDLHREVRDAFGGDPRIVDGDDRGVAQAREQPRLVEETCLHRLDVDVDELERDPAAERRVLGLPDLAHAAAPEDPDQTIAICDHIAAREPTELGCARHRRLGAVLATRCHQSEPENTNPPRSVYSLQQELPALERGMSW